jgi:hypothetical protein
MAEVNKYGRISHFMKAIGEITKLTEEEDLFIQMETFIKENGEMIKPMEKVFITTTMAPVTMENGIKTFRKVSELKNGPMDLHMKGNFLYLYRQHHNGLKHGYGKFIWPDLSQYEGEFF